MDRDRDRRERHCLYLLQEDEDWPLAKVLPSGPLKADDVGESGAVVREVVEEVLGEEMEVGLGAVDGVSEHGAKRVRVGTELDIETSVNILARYAQSSTTWSGL